MDAARTTPLCLSSVSVSVSICLSVYPFIHMPASLRLFVRRAGDASEERLSLTCLCLCSPFGRVRRIFNMLNTDGDSSVDEAELEAAFQNPEFQALMQEKNIRLSTNFDSKVDVARLMACTQAVKSTCGG